jgi:hypothetical protein
MLMALRASLTHQWGDKVINPGSEQSARFFSHQHALACGRMFLEGPIFLSLPSFLSLAKLALVPDSGEKVS